MTGRLYGVGLGPGDPGLVTLKAARLIEAAQVVAYPSLPDTPSFARSIAADLIAPGSREIVVEMPITEAREPAQAGYDRGAAAIAEVLDAGEDVVMLCEGDPLFYGSFMYLHARLAPRYTVEVVPGVSSLAAAAARAGKPLTARNEVLAAIPAPLPDGAIRKRMEMADAAAIVKLGRHLPRVRALIEELGLTGKSIYVARATLAGEVVLPLVEAPEEAPYFSMILVTKGADPWIR